MVTSFKSAGVSTRVINLTGPTSVQPAGVPAGVIGTSVKGPAFVPKTVATGQDFVVDFGVPSDERANGPMAAIEWLRNAQALTFLRVLGAGAASARELSGDNAGRVRNAGFVVGTQLPQDSLAGGLGNNPYANTGGDEGRTFLLGCYMKESGSSTIFQDAGKASEGIPLVRGLLMAPSGVYLTLSSSRAANNTPASTGTSAAATGAITGSVKITSGRQEFVMLLNGFNNSDPGFPSTITASFDPTAPNYLTNVLNTDPYKMEEAGHYLYSDWKIDPSFAVPSGSGIINDIYGVNAVSGSTSTEDVAFLLTTALTRNSGSSTVPNFENFEDRYKTAETVWVTSQLLGGKRKNLFKISALDDGEYPNQQFKISIENIVPGTDKNPYGRFDVLVRSFGDNDKNRSVLEAWRGLSLDPTSPQYIGRVVGTTKNFFDFDAPEGLQKVATEGDYENVSRYIRVELADEVENGEIDSSAVPFGFRGAPHLVTSGSAPLPDYTDSTYLSVTNPFDNTIQAPVPFRENLSRGTSTNKSVDLGLYWGVQFEDKTSVAEPNASSAQSTNIASFAKYYPNFHTDFINMVVSNNEGVADTTANGILDADRFNNNGFTLENVRIALNASGNPDTLNIADWQYVRTGNITTTATSRSLAVSDLTDSSVRNASKFSFFIHGGYEGLNVFDRKSFNMTNEAIVEEMNFSSRGITEASTVAAFNKALDIMADATEVDVQVLATPGIRHSIITDKGLQITEERFDAFYVMDVEEYDTLNLVVTSSNQIVSVNNTTTQFSNRGLNTSFGGAYFPNQILRDTFTGKTRVVAPSVAMLGVIAKNDAVKFPWFAPAGFTRGTLDTAERSAVRLSRVNMDALQEVNINPIVAFAGSGGAVSWGQKTLLQTDSSLERINVRRLLIDIRRKVKAIGNRVLFEPNREETLANFSRLINPVLKRIQDLNGLEKFLVKIDTTTTTQADVENRTIRGKIFLVPTKTLEFLSVDFVISNN